MCFGCGGVSKGMSRVNETHILADAALADAKGTSKEEATRIINPPEKTNASKSNNFSMTPTKKKALPQSSNTTNGDDDSDDEDYVIGNLEWDSGGSG